MMEIREAEQAKVEAVVSIVRAAFPDELVVAQLVRDLLADNSAQPLLSLLASVDNRAVGHVLFTAARLDTSADMRCAILAPLSVIPAMQGRGIGTELAKRGLEMLASAGTDLVFVLGHPGYYPRFGFTPAGREGFLAPYPIEAKNGDAWMVLQLGERDTSGVTGTVRCAEALDKAGYWSE
jgi:predicted N-acetyltransferase YhbS